MNVITKRLIIPHIKRNICIPRATTITTRFISSKNENIEQKIEQKNDKQLLEQNKQLLIDNVNMFKELKKIKKLSEKCPEWMEKNF